MLWIAFWFNIIKVNKKWKEKESSSTAYKSQQQFFQYYLEMVTKNVVKHCPQQCAQIACISFLFFTIKIACISSTSSYIIPL